MTAAAWRHHPAVDTLWAQWLLPVWCENETLRLIDSVVYEPFLAGARHCLTAAFLKLSVLLETIQSLRSRK